MEIKGVSFILLIVVIVLSLCLTGVVGYLFLFGGQKAGAVQAEDTTQHSTTKAYIKDYKTASKFAPFGEESEGVNFNIKSSNPNAVHVVRLDLEILTPEKETLEKLTLRSAEVKEVIGDVMNRLTYEEIVEDNVKAKKKVKEEILTELNEMFEKKIAEVVISSWFYQ